MNHEQESCGDDPAQSSPESNTRHLSIFDELSDSSAPPTQLDESPGFSHSGAKTSELPDLFRDSGNNGPVLAAEGRGLIALPRHLREGSRARTQPPSQFEDPKQLPSQDSSTKRVDPSPRRRNNSELSRNPADSPRRRRQKDTANTAEDLYFSIFGDKPVKGTVLEAPVAQEYIPASKAPKLNLGRIARGMRTGLDKLRGAKEFINQKSTAVSTRVMGAISIERSPQTTESSSRNYKRYLAIGGGTVMAAASWYFLQKYGASFSGGNSSTRVSSEPGLTHTIGERIGSVQPDSLPHSPQFTGNHTEAARSLLSQASAVVAENSVSKVLDAVNEIPNQTATHETSTVTDALQKIFSQSSVQRAAEIYERVVTENPSLLPHEIDALVEAQI